MSLKWRNVKERIMNSVTINGHTFKSSSTVVVVNGKVIVDKKEVNVGKVKDGILEIKVDGVLENLTTDASVVAGLVQGDVQAGGSVSCDDVDGDVQAGGSVSCGKVGGDVMAGGSISHN
jgi:hypothetical protein